jgi:hypothetical protein
MRLSDASFWTGHIGQNQAKPTKVTVPQTCFQNTMFAKLISHFSFSRHSISRSSRRILFMASAESSDFNVVIRKSFLRM